MNKYLLKKIGKCSYVDDFKYELYLENTLIAVIYSKEENIQEVVNMLWKESEIKSNCIIKCEEGK